MNASMILKEIYDSYLNGLEYANWEVQMNKKPMINAHAELYFHFKKSNDEGHNIPLTKYLEF